MKINKRRSSIGRRVSFSTANRVKEFITDEGKTIWNSTYEEEKSNMHSDSSACQKSDNEGFAEKSFIATGDEEMDFTCAIPKPRGESNSNEKGSSKNDMTTIFGNDDMEMTITQSVLKKKFGASNDHTFSQEKTFMNVENDGMDMTCAVAKSSKSILQQSNATIFGDDDDDMEMARSALCEKFGSKFASKQNEKANLEKSICIGLDESLDDVVSETGQTITKINDDKVTEDEMQLTCAIPKLPSSKSISKSTASKAVNDENMEMTCPVPKEFEKKSKATFSVKEPSIVSHDDEAKMELTCAIPKLMSSNLSSTSKGASNKTVNETSQTITKSNDDKVTEDEMQLTCAIPKLPSSKSISQSTANSNKPVIIDENIEITCRVPKDFLKKNKADVSVEEGMEVTCAADSSNRDLRDNENHLNNEDAGMEMTCAVPVQGLQSAIMDDKPIASTLDVIENTFHDDSHKDKDQDQDAGMELTCAVPKLMSSNSLSTSKGTSDKTVNDENMEMTCPVLKEFEKESKAIVSAKEPSIVSQYDEAKMELTCAVPKLMSSNLSSTSKGASNKTINDENMEITCRVPKDFVNVEEGMEVTCAADSSNRDLKDNENHLNKEQNDEDAGMEMTCAVPVQGLQSAIIDDKPVASTLDEIESTLGNDSAFAHKDKDQDAGMELTCAVPVLQKENDPKKDISKPNLLDHETVEHRKPTCGAESPMKDDAKFIANHDIPETAKVVTDDTEPVPEEIESNENAMDVSGPLEPEYPPRSSTILQNESRPVAAELENRISLSEEAANMTYTEPKELSKEEIDVEFEKKLKDRRDCINSLKRFLADLESSPESEGQPPAKKEKLSVKIEESTVKEVKPAMTIFQKLSEKQVPHSERVHFGHWKMEREADDFVIFSYFLGTLKLHLVLGHSMPSKSGKGVKHWAIRKATLKIVRHPEADQSIKVVSILFTHFQKLLHLSNVIRLYFPAL